MYIHVYIRTYIIHTYMNIKVLRFQKLFFHVLFHLDPGINLFELFPGPTTFPTFLLFPFLTFNTSQEKRKGGGEGEEGKKKSDSDA